LLLIERGEVSSEPRRLLLGIASYPSGIPGCVGSLTGRDLRRFGLKESSKGSSSGTKRANGGYCQSSNSDATRSVHARAILATVAFQLVEAR